MIFDQRAYNRQQNIMVIVDEEVKSTHSPTIAKK